MTDAANTNTNNEPQDEITREELLKQGQSYSSSKEFEVTPEELLQISQFMKARMSDLMFEVAHAETKFANLIRYTKLLEERLNIRGEDLDKIKHPDS